MKLLFGFIISATMLVIVVGLYCASIIAGHSDEQAEIENNKEADEMFLKNQICPKCKTGKYTYDLDPKSDVCPYIECCKRNKCCFYKPLEKAPKTGILSNLRDKRSLPPPRKNDGLRGF